MTKCREARCAFVVIKLKINAKDYLVLRRDKDWNDLSLIGGHQEEKDNGRFRRTAKREMYEELSALRGKTDVVLNPITEPIHYGPIWSRSAKCDSEYQLMFYWAKLQTDPRALERTFSVRSANFLVELGSLKAAMEREDVSSFLSILESEVPGGLEAIPYSWDRDLGRILNKNVLLKKFQSQLPLFPERAT